MFIALILKLPSSFNLEPSLYLYSLVFSRFPAHPPTFILAILAILPSPSRSMATNYELHSTSPSKLSHEDADRPWNQDASQLTRLGKKPVLKVRA